MHAHRPLPGDGPDVGDTPLPPVRQLPRGQDPNKPPNPAGPPGGEPPRI